MNKFRAGYLIAAITIALTVSLTGCGGGGGGGVFNPVTPPVIIPAANQIALPAGYTSEAFPTIGPNVELTLNNFAAASEALMVFLNMTDSTQQLNWNVDKLSAAASTRKSEISNSKTGKQGTIAPEHAFHLMLRQQSQRQQISRQTHETARASLRPVVVGEEQNFTLYVSDTQTETVTAVCKHTEVLTGTNKNFHVFVDKTRANIANIDFVVGNIANNWESIYVKNRQTFGEEPTGVLDNGVNATDFYIVISPKVFTAGYFFTGDLNLTSVTATSNQKKIFFLQLEEIASVDERNRAVNILSATMAHEFQHMIHFWQRGSASDIWLEEAMSGYAEHVNGYRIENGINQSKALQANYYFNQVNDLRLDAWHASNDFDPTVNAHYGKVFLFGVWLAQNYGNSGSVIALLQNKTADVQAIEAFTGKNFGELYSKFMMGLIVNNPAANNAGYGIAGLDLTASYDFANNLSTVALSGPAVSDVAATFATSFSPTIAPRAAVYVRVINGDNSGLWLSATLPSGTALFQLLK